MSLLRRGSQWFKKRYGRHLKNCARARSRRRRVHRIEPLEIRQLLDATALPTSVLGLNASVGTGVTVLGGVLGSNGNLTVDKNSATHELLGRGNLTVSDAVHIVGDVVSNGAFTLSLSATVQGNVDYGGPVSLKASSVVNGNVVSARTVSVAASARVSGRVVTFGQPNVFPAGRTAGCDDLHDEPQHKGAGVSTTVPPCCLGPTAH